jgi:hypothetical protein
VGGNYFHYSRNFSSGIRVHEQLAIYMS